MLLTFTVGFIGIFSEQIEEDLFVIEVIENSNRIYKNKAKFFYYQIATGLYNILKKSNMGIKSYVQKNKKEASQRLRLFNPSNFNASFNLCT